MVLEINDNNFESEVIKADKPVLVDMWAPWCGPCRMVAPVIDKVAAQYSDKFKFTKINIDENPKSPSQYNVMSIPTLLFFKNGEVADTVVGAIPESTLISKIEEVLKQD